MSSVHQSAALVSGTVLPENPAPILGGGKLMTTSEAALWLTERGLGRTEKTLESLRVRGGRMSPPFRRVGRAVRYSEADLRDWLESVVSAPHQSTTTADAEAVA